MCSETITDLKIRGHRIIGQIMQLQLRINDLDIKTLRLHAEECRLADEDDAVAFARVQLKQANNAANIARLNVGLARLNEEMDSIGQQLMQQLTSEMTERGFDDQMGGGIGGLLANLLRRSAGGSPFDDLVAASGPRVGMYL